MDFIFYCDSLLTQVTITNCNREDMKIKVRLKGLKVGTVTHLMLQVVLLIPPRVS